MKCKTLTISKDNEAKYSRWNVFKKTKQRMLSSAWKFYTAWKFYSWVTAERINNGLINSSERLDMFHSMTPELWLYEYIHDLRRERQFDKADRLEEHFASLKNGSIFFFLSFIFTIISVWKVFTDIPIIATISKLFEVQ